jgi:hypothetical protein
VQPAFHQTSLLVGGKRSSKQRSYATATCFCFSAQPTERKKNRAHLKCDPLLNLRKRRKRYHRRNPLQGRSHLLLLESCTTALSASCAAYPLFRSYLRRCRLTSRHFSAPPADSFARLSETGSGRRSPKRTFQNESTSRLAACLTSYATSSEFVKCTMHVLEKINP